MLEDYVKINEQLGKRSGGQSFEMAKRMLTNFNCGILYVSGEWEVPEMSEPKSMV